MAYLKPAHTTKSLAAVVCRAGFLTLAAAMWLVAAVVPADAGGRGPRLSTDLIAYLNSAATADVDFIVSLPPAAVERLANRPGML